MTEAEVKDLFRADIKAHHGDSTEDSEDAYWGPNEPKWHIETDFYVFEPRRYFWNSFDTMWTIRVRFDSRGRLVEHRLSLGDCCGP